jgi:energy-coupling factor transporter transmembrane protein EcfT
MDPLLIIAILSGIALVFIFVVARIAVRWALRLAAVAALLFIVLGGAWWWFKQPVQSESKSRQTSTQSPRQSSGGANANHR